MTGIWPRTLGVCVLAVATGTACAARQPSSVTDRLLVRGAEGDGPIDPWAGGESPESEPSEIRETFQTAMAKIRHLSGTVRPLSKVARAREAERLHPELKAALQRLAAEPSATHHREVAEAYWRLGITDAAYRHLSIAARLSPEDATIHDQLARLWRDWGFPGLGLGDAHRAVYFAPGSAAARNTLGTLLHSLGRLDEARAQYQRALTIAPDAAYAHSNLCVLLIASGPGDAALETCRRAARLAPDAALARRNLERAAERWGNPALELPHVPESSAETPPVVPLVSNTPTPTPKAGVQDVRLQLRSVDAPSLMNAAWPAAGADDGYYR